MKITYNPEADVLKIFFQEGAVEKSDREQTDRILYDKDGNLVKIEISNARSRVANPEMVEYSVILPQSEAKESAVAEEPEADMTSDPYNLKRFLGAQATIYEKALAELKAGQKRSHWMWYIFPQYKGLGFSSMSQKYAIKSLDEARAYLNHPILGDRLLECTTTVLGITGRSAHQIFGSPDDLKLRSCATLFAIVSPADSLFVQLLDRFYDGQKDTKTLQLLGLEK